MLRAIKYKQSLQENINDNATRDIAMEMYINEEYRTALDDYNHIISTHSEHLEDIYQQLDECQMSACKIAARCNNNDRRRDFEQKNDHVVNPKVTFYSRLLDRIHFWLHHQFDVGMRIEQIKQNHNSNDDFEHDEEGKTSDACFDHEFAKIKREINHKRKKYKLDDSDTHQVNKYTMQIHTKPYETKFDDDEHTFIDSIFQQLPKEGVPLQVIESLQLIMSMEEYDSDALIADITKYEDGSNIIEAIKHQHFSDFIKELSFEMNCMLCFFVYLLLYHLCLTHPVFTNTFSKEI